MYLDCSADDLKLAVQVEYKDRAVKLTNGITYV